MLVYRIENHIGEGIYAKGSIGFLANKAALSQHTDKPVEGYIHPGPNHDEGLIEWWEGPWKHWSKKKQHWHYHGRLEYCCAFGSIEQMLNWYPPEGMAMIAENNDDLTWAKDMQMHISVYRIHSNKVKKGQMQVMFRKEDAVLEEIISVTKFAKQVD